MCGVSQNEICTFFWKSKTSMDSDQTLFMSGSIILETKYNRILHLIICQILTENVKCISCIVETCKAMNRRTNTGISLCV